MLRISFIGAWENKDLGNALFYLVNFKYSRWLYKPLSIKRKQHKIKELKVK